MASTKNLIFGMVAVMAMMTVNATDFQTDNWKGPPPTWPAPPPPCWGPGCAWGDPHFVGFNGRAFDFHGLDQRTYAILSDAGHQLNAHMADDINDEGTNMETLAFKHGADRVQVDYVKANNGKDGQGLAVLANGKPLSAGDKVTLPEGTVVTASEEMEIAGKSAWNQVTISTNTYELTISNPADLASDRWETRLDMHGVRIMRAPSGVVHGILGSTYEETVASVGEQESAPYPGKDSDYEVSSLFDHDFTFATYTGKTGMHVSLTRARRLLTSKAGVASVTYSMAA